MLGSELKCLGGILHEGEETVFFFLLFLFLNFFALGYIRWTYLHYFDLGNFILLRLCLELFPYSTKSKYNVPSPCDLGIRFLKSTMLAGTGLPRIYQWKMTFLKCFCLSNYRSKKCFTDWYFLSASVTSEAVR